MKEKHSFQTGSRLVQKPFPTNCIVIVRKKVKRVPQDKCELNDSAVKRLTCNQWMANKLDYRQCDKDPAKDYAISYMEMPSK